jgi:hypothetical protein
MQSLVATTVHCCSLWWYMEDGRKSRLVKNREYLFTDFCGCKVGVALYQSLVYLRQAALSGFQASIYTAYLFFQPEGVTWNLRAGVLYRALTKPSRLN